MSSYHIYHIISYDTSYPTRLIYTFTSLSLLFATYGQVLFASSEWANANALCIGGNADEYGPHEYNWYDEAAPYLFVSYDAGRSKAFLDCSSGGLASAGDETHLEINPIAESNIRMSGAPIVAFQDGAGASSLWSIDAWGAAQTNSGCEWRTDAVGFTAELAAGEDFSSQMDELVGLKQEEDEDAEDGTRTKKYMLRPGMRDRWGGDDKDGDDKPHYDRTRWGEVLQARAPAPTSPTCSPKSTKAPSAGKGSNKGRNLSSKSTKTPSARSSPTKTPTASSSSKSSKCSDKSPKSPKSTKAPSAGASATAAPTAAPYKSPKSPKSSKSEIAASP